MKARRGTRAKGFTLLEVLAVMVVLSLVATGYYGPQLLAETRRIKQAQADVIAQEVSQLGAAAQAYALGHAGAWPRQEHDCRQAHRELTDRLPEEAFDHDTAFYRGAAAGAVPFTTGDGPAHLGRYYFDCSEAPRGDRPLFRVRLMFGEDTAAWAEYIANQLPNSFVVGDQVLGLEVGWPTATALPALNDFVSRSDPEFEADLDAGGNAIFNAEEVILDSGQTLASSLQYAGIARPGNEVAKPDCPPGLVPQVVTVPVEISHPEGQSITYFKAYAQEFDTFWRVRSAVHGVENESFDGDSHVRVGVFTLCS